VPRRHERYAGAARIVDARASTFVMSRHEPTFFLNIKNGKTGWATCVH
jgi:hypothetical protein